MSKPEPPTDRAAIEAVAADPSLSPEEKQRRLADLELDLRARARAEAENMPAESAEESDDIDDALQAVHNALSELDVPR